MAGLRKDAAPSCGPCAADPTFLAKNSGIVTAIKGPDGSEPAGFGELTSWTITSGASKESARKFVQYMMDEGYLEWIGMAPEGKFPVRKGTAAEPAKFTEGWNKLPAGVDTKRPLGEVYPAEVLTAMRNGPDNMRRWAITQGHGPLLGATLGELPVAKAVNALASGSGDGAAAAKQANDAVKAIQSGLK
jgi:multiple sugar transport system substrate-binding protein